MDNMEIKDQENKVTLNSVKDVEKISGYSGDWKHDRIRLKRDLQARHVSMIAIGGSLGTGLLIGTGSALSQGGPGSILIAYMLVGWIVYIVMTCLGEMISYIPLDGFTAYATRYADPALGFAVGYVYLFKYLVITPNQLTAGALVMQYWVSREKVNPGVWITIFLVFIVIINTVGVRFFGEFEFWLSSFKVLVMLCVIILLAVLALGGGPNHDKLGFRYWRSPGAFKPYSETINGSTGKFVSFVSVFVYALFAYLGTELCGIVAAECKNPRKNIPRAMKLTLYRVVLFYSLTIFLLGLCVAFDDPLLLQSNRVTTSAAASPYVVAIRNAGIPFLADIFNACVLIFVISASNSDLYVGSRTCYGLAVDGKMPKFFANTNRWGVPYNSLIICTIFCFLAYMNISSSTATVFYLFVNVVSIFGLLSWFSILITYICFDRAFKAQKIDKASCMSYLAPMQPISAWVALIFCFFFCFIKNYTVFLKSTFDYKTFITGYIGIPIYIVCFVGYKIYYKTTWLKPEEVDLFTFKEIFDLEEEAAIELEMKKKLSQEQSWSWKSFYKIFGWIF